MIETLTMIDIFTFFHIAGGFVLGIFSYNYFKKGMKLEVPIALLFAWEVIEQNILVSWFGFLEKEPLLNSVMDLSIGISGVLIGYIFAKYLGIKEKRTMKISAFLIIILLIFAAFLYFNYPELLVQR